jgi:hypothetical protein
MDQYNKDGSFIQGSPDHVVQITGITNDNKIDYWSWGDYNTTANRDGFVSNIIMIKK